MGVHQIQVEAAWKHIRETLDTWVANVDTTKSEQVVERALRTHGMVYPDVPAFAIYHVTQGWLADTCAGGSWSMRVADAVWFPSNQLAIDALKEADMLGENANHYLVLQVQ